MQEAAGEHCALAECKQLDFLPFLCSGCSQLFCLEHRTPPSHNCRASLQNDQVTVICKLCKRCLDVPTGTDPTDFLEDHRRAETGCRSSDDMVCGADGCTQGKHRSLAIRATCPNCRNIFCVSHRYPTDHNCSAPDPTQQYPLAVRRREAQAQQQQEASLIDLALRPKTKTSVSAIEVPDNAKLSAAARAAVDKVNRCKIRARASGPKTIPVGQRLALQIIIDDNLVLQSIPISIKQKHSDERGFVVMWTWVDNNRKLGGIVDDVSKYVDCTNPNNDAFSRHRLVMLRRIDEKVTQEKWEVISGIPLTLQCSEFLKQGDTITLRMCEKS